MARAPPRRPRPSAGLRKRQRAGCSAWLSDLALRDWLREDGLTTDRRHPPLRTYRRIAAASTLISQTVIELVELGVEPGSSHCMKSGPDIARCVEASCQGTFSFSKTRPVSLHRIRLMASAGRVKWRHSCSSAWRSPAVQRSVACKLKPCTFADRVSPKGETLRAVLQRNLGRGPREWRARGSPASG